MVFAMETYCPAADGISAARIEEEVVVTDYGTEILTRFPAIDLPIASQVLISPGDDPPYPRAADGLIAGPRCRPPAAVAMAGQAIPAWSRAFCSEPM